METPLPFGSGGDIEEFSFGSGDSCFNGLREQGP